MKVLEELICQDIGRNILNTLKSCEKEFIEAANTNAIDILEEIKSVLHNEELSDFDMVDRIVYILEKNNIDCGGCHDFG